MKLFQYIAFFSIFTVVVTPVFAQTVEHQQGHSNTNKFRQLYDQFATPNIYRTASGAPGSSYYQQQADYKINIDLDDENARIKGDEVITYTNNSPDVLEYLWVQLDQNVRASDSKSPLIEESNFRHAMSPESFTNEYLKPSFDGGFKITSVKDVKGNNLEYTINQTMMRVELVEPLKSGQKFSFAISWWYNIQDYKEDDGRSGYEYFAEDGNRLYVIAQFYPRMAVYNDVEGWQNSQFWGRDEFALPFGNYEVQITVPSDHILEATGELTNRKEVFSRAMMSRYEKAKKSFDKPVLIVTQAEAEATEKKVSKRNKTWKFSAQNVRDFAFASSRKFMYDMMAVQLKDNVVMAVSLYPKEGNPLWEEWSTHVVANTLKSYSRMTFDYPYSKAVSVHADDQGMEYPMISWSYGRPNSDGTYTDQTKYGMMSVIIHEVGHNFFPMIVNSDERQWSWMDEGMNSFLEYIAEQDLGRDYPHALSPTHKVFPSRFGPPTHVVPYMSGNQSKMAPIMTKGLNSHNFGWEVYGKPTTALNILRETVMGRELFDYAFKTYANRWKFKHPTPEDFFRTMEDASAFDLDWFWRGWFYTTDYVDIGIKDVKSYKVSSEINQYGKNYAWSRNVDVNDLELIYFSEDSKLEGKDSAEVSMPLNEFLNEKMTAAERKALKQPRYFYDITFEKPGGLVMPIILEYTYADGTIETQRFPAEIWRLNDAEVRRVIASEKEIISFTVDPKQETADIDTSNNVWPR